VSVSEYVHGVRYNEKLGFEAVESSYEGISNSSCRTLLPSANEDARLDHNYSLSFVRAGKTEEHGEVGN
jgi:hypothetical protein